MKKFGICILLAALACSPVQLFHKQKGNVKYFRHLRMFPSHNLNFTNPIDPKEFKNINCFAVNYDDNHRVIGAVFLKGGKPALDENTDLSSIEIQYFENNEKWFYRDLDGKSTFDIVEFEQYEFDSEGQLLSCTNYSKDRNIIEDTLGVAAYLYTVDNLNNIKESIRLSIDGDTIIDKSGNYKCVYKYNESNNVIEIANYGSDGNLLPDKSGVAVYRYKYDGRGFLAEESYFDEYNERTMSIEGKASRVTYKFDSNGNCTLMESLDEDDNLLFIKEFGFSYVQVQYYDNGEIFQFAGFMSRYVPTLFIEFNENGKMISRIVYTILDKYPGFENEDYDYHKYRFDDDGNVKEVSFHYNSGPLHKVQGGFSRIRYKYDKNRNLTEQSFYTARGDLIEDKISGIATYKYKYSNRVLKEILRFDADGNLISQSTRKSY